MAKLPTSAKVALIVAAALVLVAVVILSSTIASYKVKLRGELALLKSEGGSTRMADLAPKLVSDGGARITHYIDPDSIKCPMPVYTPSGDDTEFSFDGTNVPDDMKVVRAFEDVGKWRGGVLAPDAEASAPPGRNRKYLAWDGRWLPYLEIYLKTNEAALNTIRQEAASADGAFQCNWGAGYAMPMSHLAVLRGAERALHVAAIVKARRGDAAAAIEDVRLGLRLRWLIDDEPVLISRFVSYALDTTAFSSLKAVLDSSRPDRASVEALLRELESRPVAKRLTAAFLGETANGIDFFAMARRNPSTLQGMAVGSYGYGINPQNPEARLALRALFNLFWMSSADEYHYLYAMRQVRAASRLPFPAALKAARLSMPTSGSASLANVVTSALIPALGRAQAAEATADAYDAMARSALALYLYRLDTGAYPSSLDALAPKYLPQVEADPFDGKALRYRVTDKGYVIYSVGEDQRDNNGTCPGDLVWEEGQ